MHAGGLKCKLAAGACKQRTRRRASELGHRKNKSNDALTREQANTHTQFCLRVWACACSFRVPVCTFVRDILGCDSVTGARWFPKRAVSPTEGLFVKENTGKNLSMFNEQRGRERGEMGEGEGGGCNRESALSRLKRPLRAKMGNEKREVSKETGV